MNSPYPLFSRVVLAQDLPKHQLRRGDMATVVEVYSLPDEAETGYSLEGFGVPNVTVEVSASQIVGVEDWRRQEALLNKLRQLSQSRLSQLEDYVDFLLQKDSAEQQSA